MESMTYIIAKSAGLSGNFLRRTLPNMRLNNASIKSTNMTVGNNEKSVISQIMRFSAPTTQTALSTISTMPKNMARAVESFFTSDMEFCFIFTPPILYLQICNLWILACAGMTVLGDLSFQCKLGIHFKF